MKYKIVIWKDVCETYVTEANSEEEARENVDDLFVSELKAELIDIDVKNCEIMEVELVG